MSNTKYEAYLVKFFMEENDQDKLNELYIDMKDRAKENQQEIPTGWHYSMDGNTAYAEFEHRNPTVLASKNKSGFFEAGY